MAHSPRSSDRPPHKTTGRPNGKPDGKPGGKAFGKPERKGPPIAGLESRQAALDLLTLVRSGATLDEALEKGRSFDDLVGPDRAFARALATTVLRRQGTIDHLIGSYIDKPLPKRAKKATDVLRLATAQSVFFETPDHAVVSTSVEMVKVYKETAGYAGLVNAVARKIARHGAASAKTLPVRTDTPGWMWRSWERAYGPDKAKAIAAAHGNEAPLDLTLRNPGDIESLAKSLEAEIVLGSSLRLKEHGPVTELPGFLEGAWWVQDVAASLPAKLLGDVSGKRVFDLCAAPGGKALQLSAGGARVVAVDINGPRLKLVQENMSRMSLFADTIKEDVLEWTPTEKADAILLDAPCTATGTIRRHPDILRSKTEDNVKALIDLQASLIDKALTMLKPGGTLVYAVCSLQREEGEKQIEAALSRHPSLTRQPIQPEEIGGLADAINPKGDLRTLPALLAEKGGMDGFFASRLVIPA